MDTNGIQQTNTKPRHHRHKSKNYLDSKSEMKKSKQKKKSKKMKSSAVARNCLTSPFHQCVNWLILVISDFSPSNIWGAYSEAKRAMRVYFRLSSTWSMGILFILTGLVLSFCSEITSPGPNYNSAVLITLLGSIQYRHFTKGSVRPQIVLALLVAYSKKSVLATIGLCKGWALYNVLQHSTEAARARKYIHRRLRVFMYPCSRPRNLLRDIKYRILAIGWLQLVVCIGYLALSIAAVTTMRFSVLMSSPAHGIPLFYFYPIKLLTSAVVGYGIYVDTDVRMCLYVSGCCGCSMGYIKNYVQNKGLGDQTMPLSYGFNPYRFYVLCAAKALDFVWGIGGWVALGTTFGSNDRVIVMVTVSVFMLIVSDVWIAILFYAVCEMINVRTKFKQLFSREESDDSELEEFDIRVEGLDGSYNGSGSSDHSQSPSPLSNSIYDQECAYHHDKETDTLLGVSTPDYRLPEIDGSQFHSSRLKL